MLSLKIGPISSLFMIINKLMKHKCKVPWVISFGQLAESFDSVLLTLCSVECSQ